MTDTNPENDTSKAKELWAHDLPGGRIVVRFEPTGYEEPKAIGSDEKLFDEVMTVIEDDYLESAIDDAVSRAARCLSSDVDSAIEEMRGIYHQLEAPDTSEISDEVCTEISGNREGILNKARRRLGLREAGE